MDNIKNIFNLLNELIDINISVYDKPILDNNLKMQELELKIWTKIDFDDVLISNRIKELNNSIRETEKKIKNVEIIAQIKEEINKLN